MNMKASGRCRPSPSSSFGCWLVLVQAHIHAHGPSTTPTRSPNAFSSPRHALAYRPHRLPYNHASILAHVRALFDSQRPFPIPARPAPHAPTALNALNAHLSCAHPPQLQIRPLVPPPLHLPMPASPSPSKAYTIRVDIRRRRACICRMYRARPSLRRSVSACP